MKNKRKLITISILTSLFIIIGAGIFYGQVKKINELKKISSESSATEEVVKAEVEEIDTINFLAGKKILSIGDSMTYLDNKSVSIGKIIGYQQVFRRQGAIVDSYGVSGATYKQYTKDLSIRKHGSLYEDVAIRKKANVKDHDYITVFAGTNDVSSNFIIGDFSSLDNPRTTLGGFNLLLQYLKETTNAKIVVFSPIYTSDHEKRPQEDMEKLVSELAKVAQLNKVEFIDIYHNFEINEKTSERYLYDKLHPNNQGMKVLGEKMLQTLETPKQHKNN